MIHFMSSANPPHYNHIFSSEASSLKSEIPSVLFRGSVDVRDDSPNGVVRWRWLSEEAGVTSSAPGLVLYHGLVYH